MTTPLSRPISDYRSVRATGGADLTVSMGQSLGAVFSEPLTGGLLSRSFERGAAAGGAFSFEQSQELLLAERERMAETRRINRTLLNFGLPEDERDELQNRLIELTKERQSNIDRATKESLEAGRLQPPEALTEQYGELGLRFDRPMTKAEAELLADSKRAEIVRQALVGKGPQGFFPGVAKFGTGVLAAAFDPVELATMFVPIVGPAKSAALVARFGKVGGRAIEGMIEGGVGNILAEPGYYALSKQAQLDYTMVDALFNVGIGFALGGVLGAGIGTAGRLREGPRSAQAGAGVGTPPAATPPTPRPAEGRAQTSPEHQRDIAQAAVRQFVNDEAVSIGRFLDGTDLRGTTTLSRIDGFAYQERQFLDEVTTRQLRPTYLVADEEGVIKTADINEARTLAAEVDGEAVPFGDGFAIRRRAQGDVLRKPSGEVATFKSNLGGRAQAEKILKKLREQGEAVNLVFRPTTRDLIITRGMSEEDLESLRLASDGMEIPTGVDAKTLKAKATELDPIQKAVKGVLAERTLAQKVLEDQEAAASASPEARASKEVDEDLSEARPDDPARIEDEIANLEAQLKEAGVLQKTDEAADELDDEIPIKFQRVPVNEMFYSPTLRAVEEAKQTQAPAKDWMSILAKSPSVKKAELEWLGVPEFLELMGDRQVTKEDLANYIRVSAIEIDEVRYADNEEIRVLQKQVEDLSRKESMAYRALDLSMTNFAVNMDYSASNAINLAYSARRLIGIHTKSIEELRERINTIREDRPATPETTTLQNGIGVPTDSDRVDKVVHLLEAYVDENDLTALGDFLSIRTQRREIQDRLNELVSDGQEPRYEDYTEQGGTNYREVLITVPNLENKGPNNVYSTEARALFAQMNAIAPYDAVRGLRDESRVPPERRSEFNELRRQFGEVMARDREKISDNQRGKEAFVHSSHFDEPNIVVHMRVKDRVGPNGEKVLFIEEIQSDLETKWRDAPDPETAERITELREREQVLFDASQSHYYDIAEVIGGVSNYELRRTLADPDSWSDHTAGIYEEIRSHPAALEAYNKWAELVREQNDINSQVLMLGSDKSFDASIPRTPFRGEATYALAVRRMLREAAEQGYDRVSWTPGYMQARRWNNAAQEVVEHIGWREGVSAGASRVVSLRMTDGGGVFEANIDADGRVLPFEGVPEQMHGKHLSALVGPGLATRIMEEPAGNVDPGQMAFPSSGYAIAYDQHVRKAVEKFAKKHGGKVYKDETLPDFEVEGPSNESYRMQARKLGVEEFFRIGVEKGVFEPGYANYLIQNSPNNYYNIVDVDTIKATLGTDPKKIDPVWSIDMNEDMRAAAMEPQPILQTPLPGSTRVQESVAQEVLPALREELDALGLTDVGLKLDPSKEWQGAFKPSRHGPMDVIIANAIDPKATLYHESIHAMRWMDLFDPDEWSLLSKTAEDTWLQQFDIEKRYPDLTREEQIEEAIAEAFAEFGSAKTRPDSAMLKIWQKVERLLAAVRAAFKGKTVEDVFGAAYSGEVGGRARGGQGGLATAQQRNNVTDLNAAREERKINEFHKKFMDDIREKVGEMAETLRGALDEGFFEGYRVGDRVMGRTGDGTRRPFQITGFIMRKYDNLAKSSFKRLGFEPRLYDGANGKQYVAMFKTKGDDFESEAYVDAVRGLGYETMTGPRAMEQRQPLSQDELSPETRAELDDLPEMEKRFDAWKKAIEVAADCVGGRA